jgi:hypothetical protein
MMGSCAESLSNHWRVEVRKINVIACALLAVLVVIVLGSADDVDNLIGVRTGRAVALVKGQPLRGGTLADVVGSRARWAGRHQGELWRTFVTCRTVHDGHEIVYHWEVDHGVSPRLGYERAAGVFITPLTRATAALAPELLPGELRAERLPLGPSLSARAIYQEIGIAPTPPLPRAIQSALEPPR